MKKWAIAVLAAILVLSVGMTAWSDEGTGRNIVLKIGDPYMTVNGVKQEVDPGRSTKPVVESNRTLVPVRTIVENMGGAVNWVPLRQEVTITLNDKIVTMTLGSDNAYIETLHNATPSAPAQWVKKLQKLDVPARAVNGRTMVPIRFVTESLGATVNWNERQKTVTINFTMPQGNTKPTITPTIGNTTTTTGNTTTTTGNTTTTTGNTTTPTGNTTTTTGNTTTTTGNTTTPTGNTTTPTGNTTTTTGNTTATTGNTTTTTGNTTTTTGNTTTTTGNTTTTENTTTPNVDTTTTTGNTTTTTGNTGTTGNTVPDSGNTAGQVNSCASCHPGH